MPIAPDVKLGQNVVVYHPDLDNLYGCTIGDECKIATFVEIQRGVMLGRRPTRGDQSSLARLRPLSSNTSP
jgi:UDP-2-acetamido-3-amino-2,3-dideoxy-glucuronate N-acetyltransferase